MQQTQPQNLHLINPRLSENEKIALVNMEWQKLHDHFNRNAATGKKHFYFYKYTSV
jgi:hypothetical protein